MKQVTIRLSKKLYAALSVIAENKCRRTVTNYCQLVIEECIIKEYAYFFGGEKYHQRLEEIENLIPERTADAISDPLFKTKTVTVKNDSAFWDLTSYGFLFAIRGKIIWNTKLNQIVEPAILLKIYNKKASELCSVFANNHPIYKLLDSEPEQKRDGTTKEYDNPVDYYVIDQKKERDWKKKKEKYNRFQ